MRTNCEGRGARGESRRARDQGSARSFFSRPSPVPPCPSSPGFTLVELLVSIALFSVVALVIMGAVTSIINANRKAQTMISVINNLNFALESMTRTIKTGSNLEIDPDGTGLGTVVSVCDEDGRATTYYFDEPGMRIMVQRELGNDCDDAAAATEMALTAPEVKITGLAFYGFPAAGGGGGAATQPAVLMSTQGFMELAGGIRSDFNVQTTVAMRALLIE